MKTAAELKLERSGKVTEMQQIVDAANARDENKREFTSEEQTKWDGLDVEVRALTVKVQTAERMEEIAVMGGDNGNHQARSDTSDEDGEDGQHQHQRGNKGPIIKKKAAPYSVGKAIREFRIGEEKLTGIEAEQHKELGRGIVSEGLLVPYQHQRATQTTTTNASSIDVVIDPGLSIIGQAPLWAEMGMTVLPGLKGQLKLGKKTPDVAEKVGEETAITQQGAVPTHVIMAAERFGITQNFTKELLAQENPAVAAAIVGDMVTGCDRAITAEAYAVALAAATEVAAGAITKAGFDALMGAVDIDGAFAMDRASFFAAKGVKIDTGSGRFLTTLGAMNGVGVTYDGVKSLYSTLFADGANQQYIVYGGWKEMYLGFWGALEILINPFTYQKEGEIEITVNKLADVKSRNDSAFVKSPDLDPVT